MRSTPIRAIFLSVALAGAALTASAGITSNIDRNFNVAAGGNLVVRTDFGDVDVRSGAPGAVSVHVDREAKTSDRDDAAKEFRNFEISVTQTGNTIEVKGKNLRGMSLFNWGSSRLKIHYIITVPTQFNADVSTAGGDIHIGQLAGAVRSDTSGGDISIGQTSGTIHARTSGGDVRLDGASAAIDAGSSGGDIRVGNAGSGATLKTSGGDIVVGTVSGELVAKTSGGNITIQQAGSGRIDAETSGGGISAHFTAQPSGDSKLHTSGGSVDVYLPSDARLKIDAETSGGGVSTDVPVTVLGSHNRDELHGTVNGGGPLLVLSSSGGSIRIHRQ